MMIFIWILCGIGSVIFTFTIRHIAYLHDKFSYYPSSSSQKYKWCKVSYPFIFLLVLSFSLGIFSIIPLLIVNMVAGLALLVEHGHKLNIKEVDLCDLINIRISINPNENGKEIK